MTSPVHALPPPPMHPEVEGTHRREDRAGSWWIGTVVTLVVLGLAAIATTLTLTRSATEATDQVEQRTEERDATADQLTDLATLIGQACTSGTIPAEYRQACAEAEQVQSQPIPGRPGADGPPGPAGPAGPQGPAGRDGVGPACLADPAQCRGVNGLDGSDGVDGAPGAPGQPGEPGPAGPVGEPGPAGPAGQDGGQCAAPQVWAHVVYADGQTGSGCVDPPPEEE